MSRSLHHSNLLVGTRREAESHLQAYCQDLGIELANNPDFFPFRMDTFGIDEARQLKVLSAHKPLTQQKIFLISPTHITLEAQNALLKTFEDPSPDTVFFLVAREEALIIPTLLSRLKVTLLSRSLDSGSGRAEHFLSSPIKDRLAFSKKFVEEEESLMVFLDDLLRLLRQEKVKEELVEQVYKFRLLINDNNLLPRLIIEHLALVL